MHGARRRRPGAGGTPAPRVAFVITGLTGKLHASLEMASRLREEGHAIIFLSPFDAAREPIEANGFAFASLPDVNFDFEDEERRMPTAERWPRRALYHLRHRGQLYAEGKRVLRLDAFERTLRELSPDRAIIDMELHEPILAAAALGIPTVLFSSWFSNRTGPSLPPIRTTIVPGTGWRGSTAGLTLAWMVERARVRARRLIDRARLHHYRGWVLRRYARQIGMSRAGMRASSFPPLFTYTELPVRTVVMRELDFPHIPDPNLVYVGPMVRVGRVDAARTDERSLREVERLLEIGERAGKRLVYCSVGSFHAGDVGFLNRVLRAVAEEPNWMLILSLGNTLSPDALRDVPANAHAFRWVPQLKVLARADCSINHGGSHSIAECIRFAVPMLVYSGKRYDQNGCAARVQYHGLGLMRDKDRDGPDEIRRQIRRVLDDARFAERARHFRALAETYAGRPLGPILFGDEG